MWRGIRLIRRRLWIRSSLWLRCFWWHRPSGCWLFLCWWGRIGWILEHPRWGSWRSIDRRSLWLCFWGRWTCIWRRSSFTVRGGVVWRRGRLLGRRVILWDIIICVGGLHTLFIGWAYLLELLMVVQIWWTLFRCWWWRRWAVSGYLYVYCFFCFVEDFEDGFYFLSEGEEAVGFSVEFFFSG